MNILVITAQKPDSTGSGVYVAETALSDGETAALIAEISRLVWQRLSAE